MGYMKSTQYDYYDTPLYSGDGSVVVDHIALSTNYTSGYMVSRWLTSSGWGCSTIADNCLQYVGVAYDTPSSVGDKIRVVIEGLAENVLMSCSTGTTFAAGDMAQLTSNCAFSTGTTFTAVMTTRTFGIWMSSGTGVGPVWIIDKNRRIESST